MKDILSNTLIATLLSKVKQLEDRIYTFADTKKGDKGEKGDKGDRGLPGLDGYVGRDGRDGNDGKDGKDGISPNPITVALEASRMAQDELLPLIPKVDTIEQDLPKLGEKIRDGLEILQGSERLDKSAIRGLEDLEKQITEAKNVRVIGGQAGLRLFIDEVKFGLIKTLDFKAGSGVSIAHSVVNGLDTITINATGSGITVETPTEIPDGIITVFTVSAQPKWCVADGITYYEGAGYSYATLSVTFDVAPSATVRAII